MNLAKLITPTAERVYRVIHERLVLESRPGVELPYQAFTRIGRATIAKLAGVSARTVTASIPRLVELGLIKLEIRDGYQHGFALPEQKKRDSASV